MEVLGHFITRRLDAVQKRIFLVPKCPNTLRPKCFDSFVNIYIRNIKTVWYRKLHMKT